MTHLTQHTVRSTAFLLVGAHFCLSLGGLLLHLRIHPLSNGLFNYWPLFFGLMNCLALPPLFLMRATVGVAYIMNALTVAAGTVGMAWFSFMTLMPPLDLYAVVLASTFPDIVILAAKLFLAHAILLAVRPRRPAPDRGCRGEARP